MKKFIALTFISLFLFTTSSIAKSKPPIIAKPTLSKKIGQMLIIGFEGHELHEKDPIVSDILNQRIGGVILFDYNFQKKNHNKNIKNPKQLRHLIRQLQHYANIAAKNHQNQLTPLFIAIDYEGGKVNRLKPTYGFPKTFSQESLGKFSAIRLRHYARQMVNTLKKNQINLNFAPVVDVNTNPKNPNLGQLGRCFSNNPNTVDELAQIVTQEYQRRNVLCAYKHFPGLGSATKDTHKGFVDVSNTWSKKELIPYKKLFQMHRPCAFVMSTHTVNRQLDPKGYPATLSRTILTDVLRYQLGFQGIIVTDDMQMKGITHLYGMEKSLILATHAGVNLFIFGNQLDYDPEIAKKFLQIMKMAIKTGKISQKQIEASYKRIMKVKAILKFN
jgi:beta-N-acetylhexosaminidase